MRGRISHLWDYQGLFNLSAWTYVDTDKAFLKDNPVTPSDVRMHSLLVDSTGSPLFVGDPSRSGHMMTAFKLALQNNQK